MKIDRDEARRVAALAQLQFDDEALDRMALEMTAILSYVDQLQELELPDGEEADSLPTPLRADTPHLPLDQPDVERNAPAWRDGFFVVPRVIAGE
ncbi:MAG TPA: Asp-tRNA(Asn)/Glu-tRNA(Gln) amidotransferase subunit GatC [Thermoanaerobaculia bacterium]